MKRKITLLLPAALLAPRIALAEEGVRVAGSRLPYLIGGVAAIAIGIFLFAGMLAGRQKREVMVTPTGLPIPLPLIPLLLGIVVGIAAFTATPKDSYVLDGVRYRLGGASAAAVGFAEDAGIPEALSLPEKVGGVPLTSVGGFSGSAIREVSLPACVTKIQDRAFKGCDRLETVCFRAEGGNNVEIGREAFRDCAALTGFENLSDAGAVRDCAFYGCTALKEVPPGMEALGSQCFEGCASLRKLQLEIRDVPGKAFRACTALEAVEIDPGTFDLITIKEEAFEGCSALREVRVKRVGYIEARAFADCPALTRVEMEKVQGNFSGKAFEGSAGVLVYCGDASTLSKAQKAGATIAQDE